MKKVISTLLVLTMLLSLCGFAFAEDTREKVTIWHLWTGTNEISMQAAVDHFNSIQDKYFVESLSVPDEQKIKVAIASGEGPDITDSFSSAVASYAAQGIMVPLDDYIKRDGYDMSQFVPVTLDICKYQGVQYALPININLMMLFCNTDMFEKAGLELPKTDAELLNAAIKLTEVNEDGTLKTLGFPDFPWVYYLSTFAYAFGANYTNEDSTKETIDTEGFRRALEIMVEYRKQFGVDNVIRFQSGGAYLDGSDPFVNGTQAMRVDGPWMGANLKMLESKVNYKAIPVPYLTGHEDQAGRAVASSSMFYIPSTAKNPDGAWEFMKFICGPEGAYDFLIPGGDLPANIQLLGNEDFKKRADFDAFSEMAKSPNLTFLPVFDNFNEYSKLIEDEAELVVNGKKTIDEAIKTIQDYALDLF